MEMNLVGTDGITILMNIFKTFINDYYEEIHKFYNMLL